MSVIHRKSSLTIGLSALLAGVLGVCLAGGQHDGQTLPGSVARPEPLTIQPIPAAFGNSVVEEPIAAPGPIPAGKGVLVGEFRNRIQGDYRLRRVICAVDDTVVYDRPTTADPVMLFRSALRPGKHTVSLGADYDGNPMAASAYLQGYHFHFSTSQSIVVRKGEQLSVSIEGRELRGPIAAWDRPILSLSITEQPKPSPSRVVPRHASADTARDEALALEGQTDWMM